MIRVFVLTLISFLGVEALAVEPKVESSKSVPCAILKEFEGEVQILDSSRKSMIHTNLDVGVPCGAWVTVREGWAELKHRQGFVFKLSPHTFVEIFDNYQDRTWTGKDQIVLYRGKIFARVGQGSDELRVLTPNARARTTQGVILVLYSQADEETQLVSLESKAMLENRFEEAGKMAIHSGEATELNFRQLRVLPSLPKAVSLASLRERVQDLPLNKHEKKAAYRSIRNRANRKFASDLTKTKKQPRRVLASDRGPSAKNDPTTRKKMVKKLVGGAKNGEKLLFPGKKPKKAGVVVRDPAEKMVKQSAAKERKEKGKLIEKLSNLRNEE